MKRIAFICGPQLGHVGRLHKIAERLKKKFPTELTLIVPRDDKFARTVFGEDCNIIVVPATEEAVFSKAEIFADALAQVFQSTRFDLIVQDIGVFDWLPLVKFPDCPRAVVTNVFLSKVTNSETLQVRNMSERGDELNRMREERNLPQLESVFDLYEADRVFLADPLPIVREFGELPSHYVACGATSWTMEGSLPPELEDKRDLLLMSMGSTGRHGFNPRQIERVRVRSGCSHSVYVGSRFEKMRDKGVAQFQYEWLPLEEVLSRTKIALSQGGAGSSYQALSKGVPVIALPLHRNQEVLGETLENLGVGICIPKTERPGQILNSIDFEALAKNAKQFAIETAHEDGAGTIAEAIEELL